MKRRVLLLSAVIAIAVTACNSGNDGAVRVVERQPTSEAMSYVRGAFRMIQRGDIDGAIAAAERAVSDSPDAFEVRLGAGQVLMSARALDQAELHLERALQLRPEHAGALEMRAHIAYQQRQFRQALELYKRSADRESSPFVWQGIASAYRELYRPDSAAMAFERALALDSAFVPALAGIAEVREDEGSYADALHLAERASRLSPRARSVQTLRSRLLVRVGRSAEALPILEELVHGDARDYESLYNLGIAYRNVGREVDARETLARAAEQRRLQRARKPL